VGEEQESISTKIVIALIGAAFTVTWLTMGALWHEITETKAIALTARPDPWTGSQARDQEARIRTYVSQSIELMHARHEADAREIKAMDGEALRRIQILEAQIKELSAENILSGRNCLSLQNRVSDLEKRLDRMTSSGTRTAGKSGASPISTN